MCCTFIRICHTHEIKERCKRIHSFRSRSYIYDARGMATFCQTFSMQSISSLVTRCYVLEHTLSNLQGTKANMQWSDHTFPAISLQYIPWTPFPLFWPDVMWRLRLSVGAYTDQSGEDKGKGNPGNSPFHPRAQPQNLSNMFVTILLMIEEYQTAWVCLIYFFKAW